MSFFKKALASIGVGAAKVDTVLTKDQVVVGEELTGTVYVRGGEVKQEIDSIYVSICTEVVKEHNDKKYKENAVLNKYKLNEQFVINEGETKEIPFSIAMPYNMPLTVGTTRVWVQTGLDIKTALDPQDMDYIQVTPTSLMHTVLQDVQDAGFRLREAENKSTHHGVKQEFEFVPVHGQFRGKLDELEVTFISIDKDEVTLLLQVDRRANGLGGFLSEALGTDETHLTLVVTSNNVHEFSNKLNDVLRRYS